MRRESQRHGMARTGLRTNENKINPSGEKRAVILARHLVERWDLIEGRLAARARRRRRRAEEVILSALLFVVRGTPRGFPNCFSTLAAIIFLIAYKTAEPVSCD